MSRPATPAFDLTDLPPVEPRHLMIAMQIAIEHGCGLSVLHGLDEATARSLEQAFWQRFSGETAEGVASLLRFRSLSGLFKSRRLEAMLLEQGFALLAPAVHLAAGMRLNVSWGFNPQRFLIALAAMTAQPTPAPVRGEARVRRVRPQMDLAA